MTIVFRDVVKRFPGMDRPALDGVSGAVYPGCMTGLVGPDGAGKTTLMRLLVGLLWADAGSVSVAGFDARTQAGQIHPITGYMPQRFGLYEDLSVIENLRLYADLRDVTGELRKSRFAELLHFTALESFQSRLAGQLSGGMKQKLGLACALLGQPKVLLLDEPSVGVDPISRRELWRMVRELLTEGMAVVWSTSYLDEAEKCDAVLLLNEGKVLYDGAPGDMLRPETPRFEDAFIAMLGGGPTGVSALGEATAEKPDSGEAVVIAEGLTKRFGDFTAVKENSFHIRRGEIFGLLGPNGAGKSTTFRMLCGLLQPTAGTARVMGLDLGRFSYQARSRIGYMAQKFSLYGSLSVLQNLHFFSGVYGLSGKARQERIEMMISLFNFSSYLGMSAETLPLGFKQRLALACAVMHQPDVLFLDEPTSGVDPVTRREFWLHIKGMARKGVTVMVTTHFMDEAEYCDRIALIYRGENIATGTPDDLKQRARVERLEDAFIALVEQSDVARAAMPARAGEQA